MASDPEELGPASWREVLSASVGLPGWTRRDVRGGRTLCAYRFRDGWGWSVADSRGVVVAHGSEETADEAKDAADQA